MLSKLPGLSSPLSPSPTTVPLCTTSIPPLGDRRISLPSFPPALGSGTVPQVWGGRTALRGRRAVPARGRWQRQRLKPPVSRQRQRPTGPTCGTAVPTRGGRCCPRGGRASSPVVAQVSLRRDPGSREKKGKPPEPSVFQGGGVRCCAWGAVKCNIGLDL